MQWSCKSTNLKYSRVHDFDKVWALSDTFLRNMVTFRAILADLGRFSGPKYRQVVVRKCSESRQRVVKSLWNYQKWILHVKLLLELTYDTKQSTSEYFLMKYVHFWVDFGQFLCKIAENLEKSRYFFSKKWILSTEKKDFSMNFFLFLVIIQ